METGKKNEDLENLFIFGYQCKIFHDDEKATYIDEGRHLIPWMGDNKLLIDRYDGRGHLYNLYEYDAELMMRGNNHMTEEEAFVEKLCDEERYLELHTDVMEKAMYEEEELKRLREALGEDSYGAVAFSYDQPIDENDESNVKANEGQDVEAIEKIEPYEAADELRVPTGMVLPDSAKLGAILEKTAGFVAQHGAQMEIVLKTKQKDNPQFNFLYYDSPLNPFYRHVVQMIKVGRYQPREMPVKAEKKDEQENVQVTANSDKNEEVSSADYLAVIQSRLPSGQIENTPYAALVKRLGKHTAASAATNVTNSDSKSTVMSNGGDKKSLAAKVAQQNSEKDWQDTGSPSQILEDEYDMHTYNNGFTDLDASNQPPPPGTDTPLHLSYYHSSEFAHTAHNGSDVPSDMPDIHNPQIIPPPPDQQLVVDRMASYAAKNGSDFEVIVKRKQDPRFDFLYHWHVYNAYYEYKKSLCRKVLEEEAKNVKANTNHDELPAHSDNDNISSNHSSIPKSISFSIKTKEAENATQRTTKGKIKLGESSDDEGSDEAEFWKKNDDKPVDSGQNTPVTEKNPEELERKQVTERLKDRLAAATRERMAKDKQLQAERKRKAAAFVNMLKGGPSSLPLSNSTASLDNLASRSDDEGLVMKMPTDSFSSTSEIESLAVSTLPESKFSSIDNSRDTTDYSQPSSSSKVYLRRSRSPSHHSSRRSSRSRSRTPVLYKKSRRSRSRDKTEYDSQMTKSDQGHDRYRNYHNSFTSLHESYQNERVGERVREEYDRRNERQMTASERHYQKKSHVDDRSRNSYDNKTETKLHSHHKKKSKKPKKDDRQSPHRKTKETEFSTSSSREPNSLAQLASYPNETIFSIQEAAPLVQNKDPKLNKVKAMLKASRREIFKEDFLPLIKDGL